MVSFIALLLRKQTNENSYPVYTCTMGIRQFHKYFPVLNYGQLEREERERIKTKMNALITRKLDYYSGCYTQKIQSHIPV